MGTFDSDGTQMLAINADDEIMKHWIKGTGAVIIDRKEISSKIMDSKWPNHIPVSFRSMTKRKEIWKCWETGRPFYYIDNGYMGNLMKKKFFYRIVKNDVQHYTYKKMPDDRWSTLLSLSPYMEYTGKKDQSQQNGAILLVTPSEKPCAFYKISKDEWVKNTIAEIKKYTNRPIKIRDKGLRFERIRENSVAHQCRNENIHSVVTYQSVAALEAMHYGIPAFTMAPCCVTPLSNTDLSRIEDPFYPEKDQMLELLHYLAYCQYTLDEMGNGTALKIIERNNLTNETV